MTEHSKKKEEKKTTKTKRLPTLPEWLNGIVVGMANQIYDRTGWSRVLGVSPQAVGHWLNGQDTPSAANLDAILSVLEASYAELVSAQLRTFAEMATRPMREVSPSARRGDITLDDYRTEAYRERLERALKALPGNEQRLILSDATLACRERLLKPRGSTITYDVPRLVPGRSGSVAAESTRLTSVPMPHYEPKRRSVWETQQKVVA